MINALLKGIFTLITKLVSLLLYPINLAISQFLPSIDNALSKVGAFFNWAVDGVSWCWSWLGLSNITATLFVSYIIFSLSVPLIVSTVKLAIKWYDKLKP